MERKKILSDNTTVQDKFPTELQVLNWDRGSYYISCKLGCKVLLVIRTAYGNDRKRYSQWKIVELHEFCE